MSTLTEAEIRTFVEGATQYFEVSARQPAAVGSPYLVTDGPPAVHEYTGVIGISGRRKGAVCFTALSIDGAEGCRGRFWRSAQAPADENLCSCICRPHSPHSHSECCECS